MISFDPNLDPGNRRDLLRLREEMTAELKHNILPWWIKHAPDEQYGGFHGHLTHLNEAVKEAGKGAVLNARILWTFSAAWRLYGDPSYSRMAKRACDYIVTRFMDKELGGVYWELDHRGGVKSERKQIYALAFTLYGLMEYHRAAGSQKALDGALSLFELIETRAKDRERNGYLEAFGRDWSPLADVRLSVKDDNESKTMNTHLHILEAYTHLCRVWREPSTLQALENLIRLFLEFFIDSRSGHLHLFFDDDWNLRSSLVSFGHDIECSWLLLEAAVVLGNEPLKERVQEASVRMATAALEATGRDGGLAYEFFPHTGEMDSERHWWPQAEAVVGFFNAYQVTGEGAFLEQTIRSWEYIRDRLVDPDHGEWFWSVTEEGVPQTGKEKGGFWKCPYHNGRACMEMDLRIGALTGEYQGP